MTPLAKLDIRARLDVEAQPGLSRSGVGAVTRKAFVGQNWPDVAIKLD
jgi:hypothetical protein